MEVLRKTVFRYQISVGTIPEPAEFCMPLSQMQLSQVSKIFETYPDGAYRVDHVEVSKDGIIFHNGTYVLEHCPECWGKFWRHGDTVFKDDAALGPVEQYKKWEDTENAKIAIPYIRKGSLSFETLVKDRPELIDHPLIKDEWARLIKSGELPRTRNKQDSVSRRELELYNWACWYKVNDNRLTWEGACMKACSRHPELVPRNWNNPGATLKRIANRKLDNHPRYSQLSFREPRDKKQKKLSRDRAPACHNMGSPD